MEAPEQRFGLRCHWWTLVTIPEDIRKSPAGPTTATTSPLVSLEPSAGSARPSRAIWRSWGPRRCYFWCTTHCYPKDAIGETTKECPDHLAELPEGPYNFPGDIPRSTGPSACFWRSCTTRLLIFDSEIPFISPISQRRGNKSHWKGTPILLQTHQ